MTEQEAQKLATDSGNLYMHEHYSKIPKKMRRLPTIWPP